MEDLLDNETKNFVKLNSILLVRAVNVLRKKFRQVWALYRREWDDTPYQAENLIKSNGNDLYEKVLTDPQKKKLRTGRVNDWDISLLGQIFLNVDFGVLADMNTSRKNMIKSLMSIRNTLAHHESQRISNKEFKATWLNVEGILLAFEDSKEELDELREECWIIEEPDIAILNSTSLIKATEMRNKAKVLCNDKKTLLNAINLYDEAIILPGLPNNELGILYSNRSAAYLSLGREFMALEDAKKAVQFCPFWWRAKFRLARVFHAMTKYEKAKKHYERALKCDPTNDAIKTYIAECEQLS